MVYLTFVLAAALCQSVLPITANPACPTTNPDPTTTTATPTPEPTTTIPFPTTTLSTSMIVRSSEITSECPEGYTPNGAVCYQNCPPGFKTKGFYYCQLEHGLTYGRGAGYAWRGGDGFGHTGMISRCERDQGIGNCERSGLIYYPKCKPGYSPNGCCICRANKPDCQAHGMDGNIFAASCKKKVVAKTTATE